MAKRPETDPTREAPKPGSSKGELEQYGVWVKAEPQDIIQDAPAPFAAEFDATLHGESDLIPEESFLSEDEERLLGSFDSEFETAGFEESPPRSPMDEGTLPDIEDMPPLEEALLESASSSGSDIEDFGASTIDIQLEDIERPFDTSHIGPNTDLDMSTVRGLDKESKTSGGTSGVAAGGSMEDVSSEFLDSLSASPSGAEGGTGETGGADDVTSQFLDFEEETGSGAENSPSPDFEPIDIDLQFDDTIPVSSGRDESHAAGFEPVTEFDDFLRTEKEASAKNGKASNEAPPEGESFDDLAAVERDLYEKPEARETAKGGSDLSTEILLKIADELSSIRGELVSLKSQLGSLKARAPALAEAILEGEEAPKEEASGGFFDDEEDETIALTGDELDNILNTADFTEEVAETEAPEELEASEDLEAAHSPADMSLLDDGLLPENGDYSAAKAPGIEEVRIDTTEAADLDFAIEDQGEETTPSLEEIGMIAEEGISPLTSAPEDTSYLESDIGELGLSDAPMNEAPLVEPDLTDFDVEEEDLGGGAISEIEEELPVVEPSAEDLILEAEAGLDFADSEPVSELEPLEPIPETEEDAFGEINLHDEGQAEGELEDMEGLEELGGEDEAELLAERIDQATVKPALPVSLHPDEVSISLDDSYFVGESTLDDAGAPVEREEELLLSDMDEVSPEAPQPETEFEIPAAEEEDTISPLPVSSPAQQTEAGEEPDRLKSEIRSVLAYLDKLLDSLPEDKIEEFARSKYFDTYKRLFEELGLV